MTRLLQVLIFLMSLFVSCDKTAGPDAKINPNIIRVKWCCSDFNGGNFRMGVWYSQRIFGIYPGRVLDLSSNFEVKRDSLVLWPGGLFVSKNYSETKLLIVKSTYSDVSVGSLLEVNTETFKPRILRDSTYNISSALYLPSDNECIYYSYGDQARLRPAGYYKIGLSTLQDSLVFEYISEIGPAEVVNGFDVSPDGTKLLFPINRAAELPLIVEHTLATGERETLAVSFDRQLLWLRYHPSGNQILYSNYPRGAGGSIVGTDSEIGVIDRQTLNKRALDVNRSAGWMSVSVFPNWSPDGKHIVYGSAPGPAREPPGAKGAYSLYILRDVN